MGSPAIYRTTHKVSRFLSGFFATGAGLCMLSLFLIVFVNSVRRYGFDKSFEWGEELPVYLAIYGVMFGSAWAYLEDRHVRFTLVIGFLSEQWRRCIFILVDLIVVVSGGILAYSGALFAAKRGGVDASGLINLSRYLEQATGLGWLLMIGKLYPWQLAIFWGGVMLVIAALVKLILRLGGEDSAVTLAE